jgi:shikimate kinase
MEPRPIVILGEPASGKTTVARALARLLPGSRLIEAAQAVVYPAAHHCRTFPASARRLLGQLERVVRRKSSPVAREKARQVFHTLERRYGADFIARAVHHLYARPGRQLIVAGVRGHANAAFFRRQGCFLVFLTAPQRELARRLVERGYARSAAVRELAEERRLYRTPTVARTADLVFDTSRLDADSCARRILAALEPARECRRCVNTSRNPSLAFSKDGLCSVCAMYLLHFSPRTLARERRWLLARRGKSKPYDIMVGFSGGKDSTALLATVRRLGFRPLAFTFDTGYYPRHIFGRARRIARELGVPHERIDILKYMTRADRASYRMMAALYDEPESPVLAERFRRLYAEGRRRYSVRDRRPFPFVRTCQACRKPVIRAYYAEALRHGVRLVALGMNEWAGLSQIHTGRKPAISAIRKLQPFRGRPPVYVVHVPFLLRQKLADTRRILRGLGWKVPRGEEMVESNANSCLLARAANEKARRLLGFHPDSTRLAREVTAGFLTKEQARRALEKRVRSRATVRQVLRRAGIVR